MLDPSEIGMLVGYSEDAKGCRAYFPQKQRVEIHRDIVLQPEKENSVKNETISLDIFNSDEEEASDIQNDDSVVDDLYVDLECIRNK